MFTLTDGREHLYQWDTGRQVIVSNPAVTEVHFCNRTDECSLVVEVKEGLADIPNILLQSPFDIRVFAYCDCYTLVESTIKVKARTKPSDYVYTETEIKSYEYLDAKLTEIEQKGFSDETVTKAVEGWLYENPLAIYDDGEGNVTIETIPNGQEVKY